MKINPNLGLKLGFEIHQQLKQKLFCSCEITKTNSLPNTEQISNHLWGADKRTPSYHYLNKEDYCKYEIDEKEPNLQLANLNDSCLLSCMLGLVPLKEISFKRKRILDGSIFQGYQKTALFSKGRYKTLPLTLTLEQDSSKIISNNCFSLCRQGISLIEVTSDKIEINNEQELDSFLSILKEIGVIIRTGPVTLTEGSIRQDINISIHNGNRVEIKGASSLTILKKIILTEIERQLNEKVEKIHTRKVDGEKTVFLRTYEGNSRYSIEPELNPINIDPLTLKKKRSEAKDVLQQSLFLMNTNKNLYEEAQKSGFYDFYQKIKDELGHVSLYTVNQLSTYFKNKNNEGEGGVLSFLNRNKLKFDQITEIWRGSSSELQFRKELAKTKKYYSLIDVNYILKKITKNDYDTHNEKRKLFC